LIQKNEELEQMATSQSFDELQHQMSELLLTNSRLNEEIQVYQNRIGDLETEITQAESERDSDQIHLAEVHGSLIKEQQALKKEIQERREIQKQNKQIRQHLVELRNKFATIQSQLSLAQAENSHLNELMNEMQSKMAESQSQNEVFLKYTQTSAEF
jgi:chromosome segregation ATPase